MMDSATARIKNTSVPEIVQWLIQYRPTLNVRGLEKELGMPDGSLAKAVAGTQPLAKRWQEELEKYREKICSKC